MRGLNLDHLRAFTEVARRGSFSAAADELSLTQPAVSQQIGQLEKRLGVKLIERLGRRAMPTAAGLELLDHAARIDGAVSAATEALARHAKGEFGRVRIGTGATACIYLLPPILRRLRQRFPSLEIAVSVGNTPDMLRDIEDNRLDVGLVTLPAAGRALEVTSVLEDEFVAISSRDGVALPARVTAAAMARLPVLLFGPGGNTRRIADQWFARARVALKPAMALDSIEAIKQLVGAGLGCSIVPRMALQGREGRTKLVVRSLSPPLYRRLAIVVRRDKVLHRGLNETIRALGELAGKSPQKGA
jgi:DNA-binding transcriptional LysR family regulator